MVRERLSRKEIIAEAKENVRSFGAVRALSSRAKLGFSELVIRAREIMAENYIRLTVNLRDPNNSQLLPDYMRKMDEGRAVMVDPGSPSEYGLALGPEGRIFKVKSVFGGGPEGKKPIRKGEEYLFACIRLEKLWRLQEKVLRRKEKEAREEAEKKGKAIRKAAVKSTAEPVTVFQASS